MTVGLNRKYRISRFLKELSEKVPGYYYYINNFDLRKIVLENRDKTMYNLFYGNLNPREEAQVNSLSDLPYVRTFSVKSYRHGIARFFVKDGSFQKMIEKICNDKGVK